MVNGDNSDRYFVIVLLSECLCVCVCQSVVTERDESRCAYLSAINAFLQQVQEMPVNDRLGHIRVCI